jgi:carboxylesterase type B
MRQVVAVNYRLNAFGWLGAEALRDNSLNSTGNYGLQVPPNPTNRD